MRFEDGSLQKIFESLGRIAGVNVLFDEGFRDKKASVNLTGVTFEEALDRLTFVNRLFYKVVDQNTLIIVPESRQKRVAYDELLLRTFYVQNAEINDTVTLIKTLAKITTVGPNASLGAITVLGTVDQIAMAERIIEANDKARGEVLVEVQFLEVNRNAVKEWGLNLSNYTAAATLSPTGRQGEVATGGVLNIRAPPALVAEPGGLDREPALDARSRSSSQSDSTARILAAPRLRAAEGKKAELKIGTEVPIPVTSYTVGTGGGTAGLPARHELPVQDRRREPEPHPARVGERRHHAGDGRGVQPPRRRPQRRHREQPDPRADLLHPERDGRAAPARRGDGPDRRPAAGREATELRRSARHEQHPDPRQALRQPPEDERRDRGPDLDHAAHRAGRRR